MEFRCSIVVRQEPYRVDEIVSLRSEFAKPWKYEDKMTDIEFELGAPAKAFAVTLSLVERSAGSD